MYASSRSRDARIQVPEIRSDVTGRIEGYLSSLRRGFKTCWKPASHVSFSHPFVERICHFSATKLAIITRGRVNTTKMREEKKKKREEMSENL